MAGYSRRLRQQQRADIILAHQTAAMTRTSKFPRLGTILDKLDRAADGAPRVQSVDSMLAMAKAWTKHLGGRINGRTIQ